MKAEREPFEPSIDHRGLRLWDGAKKDFAELRTELLLMAKKGDAQEPWMIHNFGGNIDNILSRYGSDQRFKSEKPRVILEPSSRTRVAIDTWEDRNFGPVPLPSGSSDATFEIARMFPVGNDDDGHQKHRMGPAVWLRFSDKYPMFITVENDLVVNYLHGFNEGSGEKISSRALTKLVSILHNIGSYSDSMGWTINGSQIGKYDPSKGRVLITYPRPIFPPAVVTASGSKLL